MEFSDDEYNDQQHYRREGCGWVTRRSHVGVQEGPVLGCVCM